MHHGNNKHSIRYSGLREAGSLQNYLTEISRIPLLTHGEEIALAKRLDACRKRLYRGILATGHGLQAIVTLLHPVCRGTMRVDHVVELPRPGAERKTPHPGILETRRRRAPGLAGREPNRLRPCHGEGPAGPPSPVGIAAADCAMRQGNAPVGRDNHPQATPAADPGGRQADFATARQPQQGSEQDEGQPVHNATARANFKRNCPS